MLTTNMRIFLQLLHRDMILLKRSLLTRMLDAASMCLIVFIVYGHLMPNLGLDPQLIAPFFLGGTFTNIFLMLGFSIAIALLFEIKQKGRLFYLMTLPISLPWLFATYVVSFMIQVTAIIVPTITIGILLLGSRFQVIETNWPLCILVYLLSALFFGILMITIGIHYKQHWFLDNVWPRRLGPMFCFGCTLFLWKPVYAYAPRIAQLMLINPLVYVNEGLRSSFVGGDMFIPAWICIIMLSIFCIIGTFLLMISIRKQLDPV